MGLFDWLSDSLGSVMGGGGGGGGGMQFPPVQTMEISPYDLRRPPEPNAMDIARLLPTMDGSGGPHPGMPPVQDMNMPREALMRGPPPPMGAVPEPMMPPGSLPAPPPPGDQPRFNPAQSDLPFNMDQPRFNPARTEIGAPQPSGAPPVPGGGGMPTPPPVPPNAMPTAGGPSGPPLPIVPTNAPGMGAPVRDDSGGGFRLPTLARALGLNEEDARSLRGSLAGGLKAASENAHKPGLAAFAGGMGGGLEGGEKIQQRDYDERVKALSGAIAAKNAGNTELYQTRMLQYTGEKLADAKKKAADPNAVKSAWNKPETQRYSDAMRGANQDKRIIDATNALKEARKFGIPDEVAKAEAAFNSTFEAVKGEYMQGLNVDPKRMQFLAENPPGSQKNPHDLKGIKREQFGNYVKPGEAYINPKDGKVYFAKKGMTSPAEE